ncbi:hypothetical protein BH11CYA1_BH11CYA1_00210 [soil metagenome]
MEFILPMIELALSFGINIGITTTTTNAPTG